MGDAAEIRSKRVRKQKTDRQDAQLILRLLLEDRFPLAQQGSAIMAAKAALLKLAGHPTWSLPQT